MSAALTLRTAPILRGVPSEPDFRGFASRRHLRAFENRAKARIDRVCLFEPAPKRKKARIFIAFTLRSDGRPGRSYSSNGAVQFGFLGYRCITSRYSKLH